MSMGLVVEVVVTGARYTQCASYLVASVERERERGGGKMVLSE